MCNVCGIFKTNQALGALESLSLIMMQFLRSHEKENDLHLLSWIEMCNLCCVGVKYQCDKKCHI